MATPPPCLSMYNLRLVSESSIKGKRERGGIGGRGRGGDRRERKGKRGTDVGEEKRNNMI